MSKFYGRVGYVEQVETAPSVWEEKATEREYCGDVQKNYAQWNKSEYLNDDLNINNQISIIADAYAYKHFGAIRYIEWMNAFWTVTSVEVQSPRLILSVGGVYNGRKA